MYRYVRGEKRDNTGYARIENYENDIKITIHLKDVTNQRKEAKVYLFHREKNKLEGIYLDKITFENGIGELQIITKSKNVVKSSYEFSDISGIMVYMTSERFWATEWDGGQPIDISQFCFEKSENELEDESTEDLVFAANVEETDIQKTERQFLSFAKIYPFVEEDVECVGVKPNNLSDIHEEWRKWEENDFLLHGYNRFRHIIVGRKPKEKGYEYFLGIPGIYINQEERIANSYGFAQFVPENKENAQYGDFGYWCTNVTV